MESEEDFGVNLQSSQSNLTGSQGTITGSASDAVSLKIIIPEPSDSLCKTISDPSGSKLGKTISESSESDFLKDRDENWNWVHDQEAKEMDEDPNGQNVGICTEDDESNELEDVGFVKSSECEGLPKLYQDSAAARRVFNILVTMMRPVDIKRARRVCLTWYNYITESEEFWKRFKILQIRNEGINDWSELLSSDLVSLFHASEFHFMQSDLTLIDANLFLVGKAQTITHLSLERCILSPATLQLIFSEFVNLESINLNGLNHCIIFCESLFPSRRKPNRLQKLKSIKLCSNFDQTWAKDPLHWNVTSLNLQRNFLAEVLTSSSALESLTFSGWGSKTCSHVIEIILCHQRRFLQLSQLHFLNIAQRHLNFEHLHLLSSPFAAEMIGLRKFSLTLFAPLSLAQAEVHANFANIVIRNILMAQRGSLEVLTLDRCPVSSRIFTTEMPQLRTLSLKSTQVMKANFGHLVPALTVFKHSRHHMNFNPQWDANPPLLVDDVDNGTLWGEVNGNPVVACDELTIDHLRRQKENVRRGEVNMWTPIAIILVMLLPPTYIYLQNTLPPEYEHVIFVLVGAVALAIFMAVKGYL